MRLVFESESHGADRRARTMPSSERTLVVETPHVGVDDVHVFLCVARFPNSKPRFTVVTRTTRLDMGERSIVFRHLSSVWEVVRGDVTGQYAALEGVAFAALEVDNSIDCITAPVTLIARTHRACQGSVLCI